jgi:SET domain-containing protein
MPTTKRPFRVGRARTGLGLFATEPIRKRTIIAFYRGRKLNVEQAEKAEARGNKYLYEINSKWTIDGASRRNVARYANHSCRPNSESDTRKDKVFIRAIKDIKVGDEITYDYGDDYFKNVITPAGCKCLKCLAKRKKKRREYREAAAKRKLREARKAAKAQGVTAVKTVAKKTKSKTKAKTKKKSTTKKKASRKS